MAPVISLHRVEPLTYECHVHRYDLCSEAFEADVDPS